MESSPEPKARRRKPRYFYVVKYEDSDTSGAVVREMVDGATVISYEDAVEAVGRAQLSVAFPTYDWSNQATARTMKSDWHVGYGRSLWHGIKCVFVRRNAFVSRDEITVFTEGGANV